jgi:hypothetical protein
VRELGNRPSPDQLLVLHAALDDAGAGREAWKRWRRSVAFDAVDGGSQRLLPLVYRNLGPEAFDEEVAGRLKGLYRRSWTRNQILFEAAGGAIELLRERGIETVVLKGASLAVRTYRDAGVRPMEDVDLLVPFDRAEDALRAFLGAGWRTSREDPFGWVRIHHSLNLLGPRGGSVDLHWYTLWQPAADSAVWEAAVPIELGGVATLAPCDADQLLLTCVHGTPWSPLPPFRWIADAIVLVREAGEGLDWGRIESEARRRQLTVAAAATLSYLAEEFEAPVPAATIDRLAAAPSTRQERAAFSASCRPDGPVRTYLMARDRYRRLRDVDTDGPDPGGFIRFATKYWGLDSPWRLPVHAARGVVRRAARGFSRSGA